MCLTYTPACCTSASPAGTAFARLAYVALSAFAIPPLGIQHLISSAGCGFGDTLRSRVDSRRKTQDTSALANTIDEV